MVALIAVLKWKSPSISSVTRLIVSWIVRRNATPAGVVGVAATPPPLTVSRFAITKRQTRFRNRLAPSTP